MTSGFCRECRAWDRRTGECSAFSEYDASAPKPTQNNAAIFVRVADDHGLNVTFKTGPMFGCVKFTLNPKRVGETG